MELLANEDVIEIATSINLAMDRRTKPLHTEIEHLKSENERLRNWLEIIKEDAENLHCLSDELMQNNIERLILNPIKQALKGE